jgi:PIN domain nuclease of toxin-antitoxin system
LLLETDVLLAALNPKDPLNTSARKVVEQGGLSLSPFSLLELDVLGRARKLEMSDYNSLARDLDALLAANSILF